MKIKWKLKTKKSKYSNKAIVLDGMRFDSMAEANYYEQLKLLKSNGEISFFLRQCPIHLTAGIKYVIDFIVFYSDGLIEFVDVKGMKTDIYKLKKKQVEELYPFDITEIN